MLARSKLNSMERTISKAWIDKEFSHEEFTIINEEGNYHKLKESIRMMKSQSSNTKKNLMEENKRIGIDKIIMHNKIINNNSKS